MLYAIIVKLPISPHCWSSATALSTPSPGIQVYRYTGIQRYHRTTLGCRAFSVAGQPSGIHFRTSSEMRLRTLPGSHWKHCFSYNINVLSALEVLMTMRYINGRFTCLLTYLLTPSLVCARYLV